jgi:hypothetical protein
VTSPKLYLDGPVLIDSDIRSRPDAFKDRAPAKSWSWFVQGTGRVTECGPAVLTHVEKAR